MKNSEEVTIARLMMDSSFIKIALNAGLEKGHFTSEKMRRAFSAIQKLGQNGGKIDPIIISEITGIPANDLFSLQDGVHKIPADNFLEHIIKLKLKTLQNKFFKEMDRQSKYFSRDLDVDLDRTFQIIESIKSLDHPPKDEATLISLDEVEPKPIAWLWFNKVPAGKISLIVGDPGAGKSLFSLWMASIISRGDDWPDVKNPSVDNKGSIIILTAEDSLDDTVRVRADAMRSDVSKIKILQGMIPADKEIEFFDIKKHLKILEGAIEKIEDVKLIIFDPITAYLGDIEGNKNTQLRSALSPLAILADKYKVAIIGIHHLNKDQAKKALYRALGSVAWTATARSVWLIQLDEDDSMSQRRFFSPLKANICKNPTTLAFRVEGPLGQPRVIFERDPVDRTADELLMDDEGREKHSAIREVMIWLKQALEDGPLKAKEIYALAEENKISSATLNRAKSRLNINSYQENRQWVWGLGE